MSKKTSRNRISEKELKQIAKNYSSELEPYLNQVKIMDKKSTEFTLFLEAIEDFFKKSEKLMDIQELLMEDLAPTKTLSGLSQMTLKDSIYLIFFFFGMLESIGNSLVDMLVMLLVINGVDFHIERQYGTPRIKHATSIKELEDERVPLTTKINFLNENGVSQLASIINTKDRNAIAHMKLKIEKGIIYIRRKPADVLAINGILKIFRIYRISFNLFKHLIHNLREDSKDA